MTKEDVMERIENARVDLFFAVDDAAKLNGILLEDLPLTVRKSWLNAREAILKCEVYLKDYLNA